MTDARFDCVKPLRWSRILVSSLAASVLVLGMLALALYFFDDSAHAPDTGVRAVEIEYLTPEEAAALLGEPADPE